MPLFSSTSLALVLSARVYWSREPFSIRFMILIACSVSSELLTGLRRAADKKLDSEKLAKQRAATRTENELGHRRWRSEF